MEKYIVKKQITVNAPASKIWYALTTPEVTKKYFYGCEAHSSWKVGESLVFCRKILFYTFKLEGIIEKIEPEKLLKYKLKNRKMFGKNDPSHFSLVTIELLENSGSTLVKVSDDVGGYEGAEKRYSRSVKGWGKILDGLKETVEGS